MCKITMEEETNRSLTSSKGRGTPPLLESLPVEIQRVIEDGMLTIVVDNCLSHDICRRKKVARTRSDTLPRLPKRETNRSNSDELLHQYGVSRWRNESYHPTCSEPPTCISHPRLSKNRINRSSPGRHRSPRRVTSDNENTCSEPPTCISHPRLSKNRINRSSPGRHRSPRRVTSDDENKSSSDIYQSPQRPAMDDAEAPSHRHHRTPRRATSDDAAPRPPRRSDSSKNLMAQLDVQSPSWEENKQEHNM